MKRKPVITVIGAASTTFGPKVLRDVINHPGLGDATYRFVDTNEARLEVYDRLARRVVDKLDRGITVESTVNRDDALEGSDYVILSVDTGHYDTWSQDFSIPNKHGIRQVIGELGGPGGLFHSLRQIPLHLDFALDIEMLCPDAKVLVCSNPLNRICHAMERYCDIGEIVGLCHGVEMAVYLFLQKHLGIDGDDIETTAAGVNHFTWILDARRKSTGEDLYPRMAEVFEGLDAGVMPMSRKFMEVFGYMPGCLDSHTGEYLQYGHEFCGVGGPDFGYNLEQEKKRWEYLEKLSKDEARWDAYEKDYGDQSQSSEELRLDEFFSKRSWADTLAFPLINAIETNVGIRMPALNLLNKGTINNLPGDVFVETPAYVDGSGINALSIGDLPKGLAALNRRDVDLMGMTVEAAVMGDRRLVLQAMMLDPVVDSVSAAEKILDEMMEVNGEYLPQFE